MATERVLITGATGFTGTHAVRYYKQRGYDVIGVSRHHESKWVRQVDLTDRDEVFRVIAETQPDYILHLAAQSDVEDSWKEPLASFDANVIVTLHMLEAVRNHAPDSRVAIVGSALETEPAEAIDPPHPYSLTKTVQTLLARAWTSLYGLDVIIAQPTNLIGPGGSNGVCAIFAKRIADWEQRQVSGQLSIDHRAIKRDFLDVRDAVRAYELILTKGKKGEVYTIATGRTVLLQDVAACFTELATVPVGLTIGDKSVQTAVKALDTDKLDALGWRPSIPLRQSLSDCLDFHRNLIDRDGDSL